jgi:rhodanese-related sulfurtransferase
MQEMSPLQVYNYLQTNTNKPLLLDVREPWEYDICHIEGSKLIPMQRIPSHLDQLDPQQETIVICHHGIRSKIVSNFLEQAQFKNIINLSGGVNSWAQEVDPVMPSY